MTSKAALFACPLALTASLFATSTWAADLDVPANTTQPLSGTVIRKNVVIDGTVVVREGNLPGPFYLYLKAESITINGTIEAQEEGFKGSDAMGSGPGAGGTPPQVAMAMVAAPGGGGAHVGAGGEGRTTTCTAFAGATAGTPYDQMISVYNTSPEGLVDTFVAQGLGFGSSGGTSFSGPPNNYTGRGAHGGAVVVLEAPTITLGGDGSNPTINVNGENGSDLVGEAPGGGAGGLIWIRSPNFSFTPMARLEAKGGKGGGEGAGNTFGGSGGGGLIVLAVNADVSSLSVDVAGGTVVGGCNPTQGSPGLLDSSLAPPSCFDADGDTFNAAVCDSTANDCDDSDPAINPMAIERCDGIDNDCDGLTDLDDTDSPADLCPAGRECVSGECLPVDGGTSSGAGGGGNGQDEIQVGGGLCAYAPGSLRRWGVLAWAAAAAAALLLGRRRAASSRD